MITLRNPLGQSLLQLHDDTVSNGRGDALARVDGQTLRNRDGARLAHVEGDRIFLSPEQPSLQLAGDRLLTHAGVAVATVDGGTPAEKALLGAAFLLFCSDG
ncbi:hypothetical protein ISP17_10710 [Dyella ginsengisoli]|jgi:hypothetical protein|uniref:Uncharacterized protein n=1 Tax=Dyella ginsengisoli TaxID=363848 RepID=A0ABW8JTG7_9GAMM